MEAAGTGGLAKDRYDGTQPNETQTGRAERGISGHLYHNSDARDCARVHNGDRHYHFHAGSNCVRSTSGINPESAGGFEAEQRVERPRVEEVLEALAFPRMGFRFAAISTAYQSTCQWFFETPEYTRWRDESLRQAHHGLLWVKGKPGSGKSTITKCAVEYAQRHHMDETMIYFFFNARGERPEKSTEGMFRTLLHQMVQHVPRLSNVVGTKAVAYAQQGWPADLLSGLFREAVCKLGRGDRLCCYIDALDEGDEDEVRDMVSFLEELLEHVVGDDLGFSVYLASRHYPNISAKFSENFLLDSHKGHNTDISTYVSGKLTCRPAVLKADLIKEIIKRSSGVFLWVVLVVKDLNKESDRGHQQQLLSRLQVTPTGLTELFQHTVHDTEGTGYLLPALQLVLFAFRALTLMELHFAVLSSVEGSSETSAIWNQDLVDEASAKSFIISASKGLLEVQGLEDDHCADKASHNPLLRYVQFIHESVREYLLDCGMTLLDPTLGANLLGSCNLRLATYCEIYLEASFKHIPARKLNARGDFAAEDLEVSPRLPFLEYALRYLLDHSEVAAREGVSVHVGFGAFLYHRTRSYWDSKRYRPASYGPYPSSGVTLKDQLESNMHSSPTVLHVLASERCTGLIQQHIQAVAEWHSHERQSYIDNTSGHNWIYGTALQIALDRRFFDVAEILLEFGANANMFVKEPFVTQPPLHTAIGADQGTPLDLNMVKVLLRHGANVDTNDMDGRPALHAAVQRTRGRASVEVVRTLLQHGADLYSRDDRQNTILHTAVVTGRAEIVALILQHGIHVDVRDQNGRTPLHAAVNLRRERHAVVKSLLQHGANTNVYDDDGDTPLRLAVWYGNIRVAMTLLLHGADMRIPSGRLEGPDSILDLAEESRFCDQRTKRLMVRMLVYLTNIPPEARSEAACAPETKEWWRQLLVGGAKSVPRRKYSTV